MRTLSLSLILLALTGCPQSEEDLQSAVGQPGSPPPGGGPNGGQPGDPNTAPDPNNATPPGGGENALPVADGMAAVPATGEGTTFMKPLGFASLIGDGPSITISGTLIGSATGQIDFTEVRELDGNKMPNVLESVAAADGKFTVKVPATFANPIYVTAMVDMKKDGPTPDDLDGARLEPLKLEGTDIAVEVTVSANHDWAQKMPWAGDPSKIGLQDPGASPPKGAAPGGAPPAPGGGNPLPAGAPPAGAPPAGAPPAGAPPAGAPPAAPPAVGAPG